MATHADRTRAISTRRPERGRIRRLAIQPEECPTDTAYRHRKMALASGASAVVVTAATGPNDPRIIDAIRLGNESRSTLGHLPFAAYEEAAAKREVIFAEDSDRAVVGYALFDATNRDVRLVHLCVAAANRRQGVARRLVSWISAKHADRAGIRVRCRLDYNLGRMWTSLGFERYGETRGRGRSASPIVNYWLDHGHPRLFATPRVGVVVRASLDLNVVRDLADEARQDRDEALALLDDQFADRLALVRTPMLDAEVDEMSGDLRKLCVSVAMRFQPLTPDSRMAGEFEDWLRPIAEAVDRDFAASRQGLADIRYISEALAADLNVFVTRDETLARVLGAPAAERGLRILRPSEVIVRIDELERAEAYRPGAVQSTQFTHRLMAAGSDQALARFTTKDSKEHVATLKARVRSLTAQGADREGIYDASGNLVGVVVRKRDQSILEVPLLRVLDGPIAATLVRQLLFGLRREAVAQGAIGIRITDPYLPRTTVAAAIDDGFIPNNDVLRAIVLNHVGNASQLSEAAANSAASLGLTPPANLRPGMPPLAAAEVERAWWPGKLVDSMLPSYLIPIKQSFSQELLGAPLGLFARRDVLGLSREHIYYRSPRGLRMKAPARLLWYMSGSDAASVEPPGIVAGSLVEEVLDNSPARLHERFRHLGVWSLEQIQEVAHRGVAQAVRFSYTETFERTVPLDTVRRVVKQHPMSPRAISAEAFAEMYLEGRRRA